MGGVGDSSHKPATGEAVSQDSKSAAGGNAGESDQTITPGQADRANLFNGLFNIVLRHKPEQDQNPPATRRAPEKSNINLPIPPLELALLEAKPELERAEFEAAAIIDAGKDAVVDLDDEAEHLFRQVPAADQARIKENYKKMRTEQMQHKECSLNLDDRLELAGWMLFPDTDAECEEGRIKVGQLLSAIIDRHGRPLNPHTEAEQFAEENRLKAQIASLLKNDHDYLHNDEEINRYNQNTIAVGDHPLADGRHHLPEKFTAFNGQEFNARKLYENHMFAIFQGTYQTPLGPKERAVVNFYNEVLDQVLPASVLDDNNAAPTADGQNILNQWAGLYADYNPNLSILGKANWQAYEKQAMIQFPTMVQALRRGQLTNPEQLWDTKILADAELLKEDLEIAEARYLKVEQQERFVFMQSLPAIGRPKNAELRLPDFAHMTAYAEFHNPAMPYKEARRQQERSIIAAARDTVAGGYIKTERSANSRVYQIPKVERDNLKNWHDNGKYCPQIKYTSAHLPAQSLQTVAARKYPFWYCAPSDKAREEAIRKVKDTKNFYDEQKDNRDDSPEVREQHRKLRHDRQERLITPRPGGGMDKESVWDGCFHYDLLRGDPFKFYNQKPGINNAKPDPIFDTLLELLPDPK